MDDHSFARYEKFGRVLAFGQKNLAAVSGTDATVRSRNTQTLNRRNHPSKMN